jgi:hypothetical protein
MAMPMDQGGEGEHSTYALEESLDQDSERGTHGCTQQKQNKRTARGWLHRRDCTRGGMSVSMAKPDL